MLREYCHDVTVNTHLVIQESKVLPGEEWANPAEGWRVVLIGKGILYWVSRDDSRELGPGQVLILGPARKGSLHASRLEFARVHHLYFRPEHLVGLMSLAERVSLDSLAGSDYFRVVPAGEPIAREFNDLVVRDQNRRHFMDRCRILNLIGMILSDVLPETTTETATAPHVITSEIRFEQVIKRIPDSELMTYEPEKLAELCGCSTRHFRRMFRKHFNTSIRAKQADLRLDKARQLLAETNQKIVTVATESGYRHLGFFNTTFKKRFGMTPSEWRKKEGRARAAMASR